MCTLFVFLQVFWGYSSSAVHFADYQYLGGPSPALWGIRIVNPDTHQIDFSFLHTNLGLMALSYYVVHALPLSLEEKLQFINGLNIALQVVNALLFSRLVRLWGGPAFVTSALLIYLLYPFAASVHFWQASFVNNLAAMLFLLSLNLFSSASFKTGRGLREFILYVTPSLLLYWLSIITVEWAVSLSPIYFLLAVRSSDGTIPSLAHCRTRYPSLLSGGLYVCASIALPLLGTGHRLFAASGVYSGRYAELASQLNVPQGIAEAVVIVTNALLVYLSIGVANSIGFVLYPFLDLFDNADFIRRLSLEMWGGVGAVSLLLVGILRWSPIVSMVEVRRGTLRFVFGIGLAWTFLSYLPFTLSFAYPRNVGLMADRVNLLGSMGVSLVLGSLVCWWRAYVQTTCRQVRVLSCAASVMVVGLLLLNAQVQKASFQEAEVKELALVEAILGIQEKESTDGRQPIFLAIRNVKQATPREEIRQGLSESSMLRRLGAVGRVLFERYLVKPAAPTNFNLNGVHWFYGGVTDFWADRKGQPRPIVYRWEDPLQIEETEDAYVFAYPPTPSFKTEVKSFPKGQYKVLLLHIDDPSFQLGGHLSFRIVPYQERRLSKTGQSDK